MTDYSHLNKLAVSSTKTATYDIMQIEGAPKLTLKAATEANKPFFNALLKRGKASARIIKSKGMNADMLASYRDEDRVLYAKHVITGWSGIKDASGKEVSFSQDECSAFLGALPDYIFDEIREFATNEGNFVDDAVDVEGTSKN